MFINPLAISNSNNSIFESQQPELANKAGKQKTKEVAAGFAAILVNEMLQSARKARFDGGLLESNQTQLARKLYLQQLSTNLTAHDRLGVTQLIAQQIEYQEKGHNGKA